MQRVRIGLTGLALVFLLVLLGAVIRSASDDDPSVTNIAGQTAAPGVVVNVQDGSADPLAELGVAPGNADVANAAGDTSIKK